MCLHSNEDKSDVTIETNYKNNGGVEWQHMKWRINKEWWRAGNEEVSEHSSYFNRPELWRLASSTCSTHVGQLANDWTLSAYATDEALESIDDSLDLLGLAWVHVCPRGLGNWWIFFWILLAYRRVTSHDYFYIVWRAICNDSFSLFLDSWPGITRSRDETPWAVSFWISDLWQHFFTWAFAAIIVNVAGGLYI